METNIEQVKGHFRDAPSDIRDADKGLLILRLGLGFFFIYHGLGYFFGYTPDGGVDTLSVTLGSAGFPIPLFWAYVTAFVELFGGIAIVLGFFTKIFGSLFAVIALVAFVTVYDVSLGLQMGDIDVLTFTIALALVIAGPGRISLAQRWYREDLHRMHSSEEKQEERQDEKEKQDVNEMKEREAKEKVARKVRQKEEKENKEKQRTDKKGGDAGKTDQNTTVMS